MGVAYEEQPAFGGVGSGAPLGAAPREAAFPEFDPYLRQRYSLDVFNRGQTPFTYTVQTGEPWVRVSAPSGRVEKEVRLWVSVDWAAAPIGTRRVPVTVNGPDNRRVVIQAIVRNPSVPRREELAGFVESNGYVSMEAEHYSSAVADKPLRWERIPGLGRTLSGMTVTPVTAPSQTASGSGARLEYRMFLFDTGQVTVRAYLSPTLNFSGRPEGLRYAVSFDDEPPTTVDLSADPTGKAWDQWVSDNVFVATSRHRVALPGEHVLKFWRVDPGVVLQKLVVDAGGARPSYLGPPESYRGTKKAVALR
jgi:hypothetical protein